MGDDPIVKNAQAVGAVEAYTACRDEALKLLDAAGPYDDTRTARAMVDFCQDRLRALQDGTPQVS